MKPALLCLTLLCAGCAETTAPTPDFSRGCAYTVPVFDASGIVVLFLDVTELRPDVCADLAASKTVTAL